jgi:hypothetical protein
MKALNWFYVFCRILAALSILLIIAFFIGEGYFQRLPSANEWLLFLLFPLGLICGLVLGFRNSSWGGRISLFSIALFYIVYQRINNDIPQGYAFLVFSIPGFLFLIHGILNRYFQSRKR